MGFKLKSVLLRYKHRSCISVIFVVTCLFCICLCSASSMLSSKGGVGSIIINDGSPLCCCYHSGVKFGFIVSCSSAPASASHLYAPLGAILFLCSLHLSVLLDAVSCWADYYCAHIPVVYSSCVLFALSLISLLFLWYICVALFMLHRLHWSGSARFGSAYMVLWSWISIIWSVVRIDLFF